MKRLIKSAKIATNNHVREFPRKIKPTSYKFDLGYRTVFLNIVPDYLDNIMAFEIQLENENGDTIDKVLIDMSQEQNKPFSIKQGKNIELYSEQHDLK